MELGRKFLNRDDCEGGIRVSNVRSKPHQLGSQKRFRKNVRFIVHLFVHLQ
jgi:hypothetical protein